MAKLKPYTKYKDSNSNWLDSVPIDWNVQPLISIGRIKKVIGQTNRELLSVYLNKGVIRFTDVDEKRTNVTSKDLSKYQSVDEGDFVLNNQQAWRGSVGVSSYKGIVSPAYLIIKLDSILDPEFANYMFREKSLVSQFLIYSKGVGSIQRNLYWNDLKRIDLYIPPKDTQKAIANYLNTKSKEIDKYIKKLKKEIALLKEHRQKIISQAVTCGLDENGKLRKKPEWNECDPVPKGWKDSGVEWLGLIPEGWEQIKVKYIGEAFIGITYSPKDLVDNEDEGILVLRASNIKDGKLVFNDNVYVDLKVEKKYLVKEGDLLICSRSGSRDLIGKNVYIDKDLGFSFGAFMTVLRSKHSEYLSWFLASDFFKSQSGLYATTTINQLTLGTLNNMLVTLPKIKTEREKIIFFLKDRTAELDIEISKIQDQIEFIKEYKQSLISKVVTGKIDVRNINNNLSED